MTASQNHNLLVDRVPLDGHVLQILKLVIYLIDKLASSRNVQDPHSLIRSHGNLVLRVDINGCYDLRVIDPGLELCLAVLVGHLIREVTHVNVAVCGPDKQQVPVLVKHP